MDSLDFINTHKLILNNKEIDTIETNGDTDNKTILTKSAVNNAISSAISGGSSEFKGTFIGEYKSVDNNNPKVKINENGITLDNKSITSIETVTPSIAVNNIITSKGFTEKTYAKLSDTSQEITSNTIISTTIKTASSSEKVNINDTNGIITNQIKIGGSSAPEISSVITSSGTTGSDTNLYTGLKIDHLLDTKLNSSDAVGQKYLNSTGGERFNDYTNNVASGNYSHAGGYYTIANSYCMTAIGKYNTDDETSPGNSNRLLVVGNGGYISGDYVRSDALEVFNSGEVKINSIRSTTTPKLTIGNSTTNGQLSLDGTNYVSSITRNTALDALNNDKLTTQGYNDVTYAKLSGANFTGPISSTQDISTSGNISTTGSGTITSAGLIIASNGLKTNNIQTNTTTGKNIVSYDDSTSSTKLTYGNITDDTIITGKTTNNDNIVQVNNTLKVDKIKSYSDADPTSNKSTITLGNNEMTSLQCNETTNTDIFVTDDIYIKNGIRPCVRINTYTDNNNVFGKIDIQGHNAISHIVLDSKNGIGISSLTDIADTQQKVIIDTFSNNGARIHDGRITIKNRLNEDQIILSGKENIFNNIIYINDAISSNNSSNITNNIKMKFNIDTTNSTRNDYVEFSDNNDTPLLTIYEEGKTYSPVFTTTGSDYCELFEVYDESIPIKDYEYKFITLIDDKVKIASNEDDYILGIYSLKPGIIGNYNLDELNDKKNIQVGLLGRLVVIDNNTCKSNSYCKVDKDGYAIPYNKSDGDVPHYRVMKRIDNNKVLIMFK